MTFSAMIRIARSDIEREEESTRVMWWWIKWIREWATIGALCHEMHRREQELFDGRAQ
jgi:hypothetical protein